MIGSLRGEILERDLGVSCLTLTLGTGPKVTKALIPAAGFGTRLFPASKATKKELAAVKAAVDTLPSWSESAAKRAIVDFVEMRARGEGTGEAG